MLQILFTYISAFLFFSDGGEIDADTWELVADKDMVYVTEGVDWRGVYNAASMARNAAEAEKATAAAGRVAANDKLRQAQETASKEEQKAYKMAQARSPALC